MSLLYLNVHSRGVGDQIRDKSCSRNFWKTPKVIKEGVVKVDVSSTIDIRNGFLMQASCRDQGVYK